MACGSRGLVHDRARDLGHLAQRRREVGQLAVQVVDPEALIEPIDRDAVGEGADGLDAVEAVLVHAQLALAAQALDIVDGDLAVPDEAGIDLVDRQVAILAIHGGSHDERGVPIAGSARRRPR